MKEKWNAVDELCPHCNSVIKQAKGINKQNLKRLCFSKPTMQDIIILIMLIACLSMSFLYAKDINAYKEIIHNPEELCVYYYQNNMFQNSNNNLGNIKIINDNQQEQS